MAASLTTLVGAPKRLGEVEAGPAFAEIDGVDGEAAGVDRRRDSDRHAIPGPPVRESSDGGDHLLGCHARARIGAPRLGLSRRKSLHVRASDVDREHPRHHRIISGARRFARRLPAQGVAWRRRATEEPSLGEGWFVMHTPWNRPEMSRA